MHEIDTLPGCCGVNVLHELGYTILLPNKVVAKATKSVGYILATQTVNAPNVKYLKEQGFNVLATFINPITSHKVAIFGKKVNQR